MSVDVTYFRRIYGGFLVYRQHRQRQGGLHPVPPSPVPNVSGCRRRATRLTLYEINPVLASGRPFNTTNNYRTFANNFGTQIEHWNGFDLALARPGCRPARTLRGGISFGKQIVDNCEIADQLPEIPGTTTPAEYCHNETGWQPQYKLMGLYELPWWGLRVERQPEQSPGHRRLRRA